MNRLNTLLIIAGIALSGCSNTSQNKDAQQISVDNADSSITGIIQNRQRVGEWNEIDKKRNVRIQSYYGYNKVYGGNDTFEVQQSKYYYRDTPVMGIVFQNGFIKDLDIQRPEYISMVAPFIESYFGEHLFYLNCGNCHGWNYNYESQFSKLVKRKHEDGSLITLIREGRRPKENEPLLLQHPEMYHLDTFEINAIVKFITVVDTGLVAGSR